MKKNFFTADYFENHTIFKINSKKSGNLDISLREFLADLLQIAPCLNIYFDETSKSHQVSKTFRQKYDTLENKVFEYGSPVNILSHCSDVCIKLCAPYKDLPIHAHDQKIPVYTHGLNLLPDDFDEQMKKTNPINIKIHSSDFDEATKNFVILNWAYNQSTLEKCNMKETLAQLSHDDNLINITRSKLAHRKSELYRKLNRSSLTPYIFDLLFDEININSTNRSADTNKISPRINLKSKYDLLLIFGLCRGHAPKDNPYIKLAENSDYIFNCDLENFLSQFTLDDITIPHDKEDFRIFNDYFLERLTNINLINSIVKCFNENQNLDIGLSNYPYLAIYPLVNYRLNFVNDLKIQQSHDFRFIELIYYHTFFYFPLVTLVFSLLVAISCKKAKKPSFKEYLEKHNSFTNFNLFNLTDLNTLNPKEPFGQDASDNPEKICQEKEIYSNIYRLLYELLSNSPAWNLTSYKEVFKFYHSTTPNWQNCLELSRNVLLNSNTRYNAIEALSALVNGKVLMR